MIGLDTDIHLDVDIICSYDLFGMPMSGWGGGNQYEWHARVVCDTYLRQIGISELRKVLGKEREY